MKERVLFFLAGAGVTAVLAFFAVSVIPAETSDSDNEGHPDELNKTVAYQEGKEEEAVNAFNELEGKMNEVEDDLQAGEMSYNDLKETEQYYDVDVFHDIIDRLKTDLIDDSMILRDLETLDGLHEYALDGGVDFTPLRDVQRMIEDIQINIQGETGDPDNYHRRLTEAFGEGELATPDETRY